MIIERSTPNQWLSNCYLVADEESGQAVLIDAGGPVGPLLDRLAAISGQLDAVLITHHHRDHVAEIDQIQARYPGTPVLAHPLERERVPGATGTLQPGEPIQIGAVTIEPLHTPGHTAGMTSLLADGTDVFTGDSLYKETIAGVRTPTSTGYADLKSSIMDTLLTLPPETRIHGGHTDTTTVAYELEHNPFVRIWRGLDPEGREQCRALGEPATLILWTGDYDGGHKAWVRWPDGSDDIVPGSRIER